MRQIVEITGVGMATPEMLKVNGEARIDWIASHVDDAGIRQSLVNQPQ